MSEKELVNGLKNGPAHPLAAIGVVVDHLIQTEGDVNKERIKEVLHLLESKLQRSDSDIKRELIDAVALQLIETGSRSQFG